MTDGQRGSTDTKATGAQTRDDNTVEAGALASLQNQLLGRSVDYGASQSPTPQTRTQRTQTPIDATSANELAALVAQKLQQEVAQSATAQATPVEDKEPQKKASGLQQARTYRGDVADTVAENKITAVDIVSAEENRKAAQQPQTERSSPLPIALILGSLVLFALGGTFIGAIIYTLAPTETELRIRTQDAPLVFADNSTDRLVKTPTRNATMQTLLTFKETAKPPLGSIERVRLLTPESGDLSMNTADFLTAIEATVDSSFVRALDPRMMIGVYASDRITPFIVFKVLSYDQAFAGMLRWEDNITANLSPFLSRKNIYQNEVFVDEVIKNKDARILRDADREIAYLYAFPDRETLVITTYQYALEEIVKRLSNTRTITND